MARGIKPQCRPKITSTCQKPPISKPPTSPPTTGRSYKLPNTSPTIEERNVEIGPIIKNVSGTDIANVKNGTINNLITSGINFLKKCSTFEANQVARITGTTVFA